MINEHKARSATWRIGTVAIDDTHDKRIHNALVNAFDDDWDTPDDWPHFAAHLAGAYPATSSERPA